jgi:2'-5' RNA ligase
MMRIFIAVKLSSEIKLRLGEVQNKLKESGVDVKWVKPENIHLTLKFLGNVIELKLEPLVKEVGEVARKFSPFKIKFSGLGTFPNLKNPRVIWIGIEGEVKELLKLKGEIEENLVKLEFASEGREFKPHLTLGRVKSFQNKGELSEAVSSLNIPRIGEMEVNKISIIKSELRREGPIYTVVGEIHLDKYQGRKY